MKHYHSFQLAFLLALLVALPRVGAQMAGPLANPTLGGDSSSSASPLAVPGSGERPKNSRTVIESEEGATFENVSNTAEFTGHVVVHDPQFGLTCDKLHVIISPDRKGLAKVIAIGTVVITQEKANDRGDIVKSIGKCGKATYDPATGDVTLEDWPQIQQGINNQVATQKTTIMILNAKGHSRTTGPSRTVIVDQGSTAVTP
jgi:lipopolysaccharide export system protein LptA